MIPRRSICLPFQVVGTENINTSQIKEIHDLLSLNYVEDDAALFRFRYSSEYLQWYVTLKIIVLHLMVPTRALKTPGYFQEWHLGVRVSSNKKLVAFISGTPIMLRVREKWVYFEKFLLIFRKLNIMQLKRLFGLRNKLPLYSQEASFETPSACLDQGNHKTGEIERNIPSHLHDWCHDTYASFNVQVKHSILVRRNRSLKSSMFKIKILPSPIERPQADRHQFLRCST